MTRYFGVASWICCVLVGAGCGDDNPGTSAARRPELARQRRCGPLTIEVVDDVRVVKATPEEELPLHGAANQSGQAWERMCPADQVVVGFGGRAGALINQLIFSCAPLTIVEDAMGFSVAIGASAPLMPFPQTDCPAGQVANRQRGRASHDCALARVRAGG